MKGRLTLSLHDVRSSRSPSFLIPSGKGGPWKPIPLSALPKSKLVQVSKMGYAQSS